MKRCINIDWLELYCLEDSTLYPCNAEFFRSCGYFVSERDYGTRQYHEMFTIQDKYGEPWIEVRRNPVAANFDGRNKGMFCEFSCHLRLHNRACYDDLCVVKFEDFLFKYRYIVKRIYRLDICLDFERFDRGDDPNVIMQRYMKGKYSKINQSNLSAHGVDEWNDRLWNSLSWGNPKSMVSTKFYCKSMELDRQGSDKPYIRWAWFLCGLIDDFRDCTKRKADGTVYKPKIWRVEFSIKSSATAWYVIEPNGKVNKKQSLPHSLNLYETREQLITAFASLSTHYFHFKKFKQGVRKDRCEDKVLFEFKEQEELYHLDVNLTSKPRSNTLCTLIHRLEAYREQHNNPTVYKACDTIIEDIKKMQIYDAISDYTIDQYRFLKALLAERTSHAHQGLFEEDVKNARIKLEVLDAIF